MKVAKVFHAITPRFVDLDNGNAVDLDSYKAVAEVVVADDSIDSLESAYERTNHIDRNWQENAGVNPLVSQARSTSVGDVIQVGDEFYGVSSCGFKKVEVI